MSVSNNILKKRPVLTIATPAKTEVHTKYTLSLFSAIGSLNNYFDVTIEILPGKSNIIHARSIMLTNWFDQAGNDDLFLFIDSDHVFTAEDILCVIKEPNCDVSCGIYVSAANTPNCYPIDRANFERDNRAYFCGTGFMLIRKPICKKIYKWIKTNDKIDRVCIDSGNKNSIPFFRTRFVKNPYPDSQQKGMIWLGEDYSFCWLVRKVGGTIRAVQVQTMGHEVLQVKYFAEQNQANQPNPANPMHKLLENTEAGKQWDKKTVVYFCGFSRVTFCPDTPKLGGSEKAVVNISREWARLGYNVTVYANTKEGEYDGVKYVMTDKFNINDNFDTLILWRGFALPILGQANARNILVDFHDCSQLQMYPKTWFNKVNKAFIKSKFHQKKLPDFPQNKFVIVENGLEEVFKQIQQENQTEEAYKKKKPHRFCYTSCYLRGLDKILIFLWPLIKNKYWDAELHLYYGMDLVQQNEKQRMQNLINSSNGVIDHGRANLQELNESRIQSSFQLYLTDSDSEIDCLSIREHCMAGCIPIISNIKLYKERKGFHIDGDDFDQRYFLIAFQQICKLIDDPETLAHERKKINYTERYWGDIAKEWVTHGDFSPLE